MQKKTEEELLIFFNNETQNELSELNNSKRMLLLLQYYDVKQSDIDFYREISRGKLLKEEATKWSQKNAYNA